MHSRIIFVGGTLLLAVVIDIFLNLRQTSTLNLPATIRIRSGRRGSLPSPSKRDAAKQRRREVRQKYLYYYSHSGISNQLLGLARSAQLCFSTNRTLILPPVLPHYGEFPEEFPAFHGRTAGGGCNPYEQSANFIEAARYDAVLCKRNQYNYPTFSEIINISELSRLMNVTMIELGDFIRYKPRLASKHFIRRRTSDRLIDLDGSCTVNYRRPYSEMIDFFEANFSNDTVAIIPSAFVVRNTNSESTKFGSSVAAFPPSSKLGRALQYVRDRLPPCYIGVHVRSSDHQWFNCSSELMLPLLSEIQKEAASIMAMNESKSGSGIDGNCNNTPSVFFAGNSRKAVFCFTRILREAGFNTFVLEDFFGGNTQLHVFQMIKVERGVLFALLDQFIVSLGQRIVTRSEVGVSTFQGLIKMRHQKANGADRSIQHGSSHLVYDKRDQVDYR